MAIEAGFDLSELDALNNQLLNLAQTQYPKEAKKFLRDEANVARKKLRANTKAATKKKTGNLLKGIDRGPVKKHNGNFQIRVYNKAPHAHLIEHGHVLWVNGKQTEKFVPGRHVAAKTVLEMKETFPADADRFVDELLEKGLG